MSMTSTGDLVGPFCAFCGKPLGVYEPLIMIGRDQQVIRTSKLNHSGEQTGVMAHEDCYEKRPSWSRRPA
jgi:hypothetical protein